jgi:hypothetical protein
VRLVLKKDFDPEEDTEGYNPHESEITFRLMDEDSSTISRAKAERLARDIKRELTNPAMVWEKGWYKSTYFDNERGYDLRIFNKSRAEGEKVIRQVLSIQDDAFDSQFYQFIDHDKTFSINSGTHRVYGQTRKKPRWRPRVDVKFRYAQLLIWGRQKPVNLVENGSSLRSVIERA